MRERFEEFMHKYGNKLCALVILISSISVDTCHNSWYQPKEPEGLQDFLNKQRK